MSEKAEAKVPRQAAEGLRQRYLVRQQAERDLAAYMLGVADTLGLDRARVKGFDDERNVLILGDPE